MVSADGGISHRVRLPTGESSNESSNGRSVTGGYRQVRLVTSILQNPTSKVLSWYSLVLAETALTELGDRRSGVQISPARQTRPGSRAALRSGEVVALRNRLVAIGRHRVVAARGNEARLGCVDVSAAVPGSNVECSLRRGISGSDALHVRSGLVQAGARRSRDGRARSTDAHRAFSATSRDRSGNIS